MKKLLFFLALLCVSTCRAQTLQNPLQGPIQAASSSCAAGAATCVWMKLAPNQGTVAVTITGTFSATLVVEESSDSGITFTTLSTLTAITTATQFSVAGMTDFRVRASAYTSGSALVFLQSSTASSGSSSSGAIAAGPVLGIYLGGPNACLSSNIGNCISTFADTQQANACSWTNASTTVTCLGFSLLTSANVAANVVTYTSAVTFPSNWVAGNSVTITGYSGGDTFFSQTCTISTVTTTTLTCPLVHANAGAAQTTAQIVNNNAGPFVAADVGKSAMGAGTCANDQYQAAYGNPISASALVNINSFTNSTQVVLASIPANTSTQTAAYPAGSCFIWGHPDDSGFANLWTAAAASTTCPKIFLASSYYLVTSPPQILWGNPNSCAQASPGVSGGFGNTVLNAGMEVEGRGTINTRIFLATNFPNGDTCTHLASSASGYLNGLIHGGACFALPLMGKWQDFSIDGGYQVSASALNTKTLITSTVATLQNFGCYNYGAFVGGNSVGIEAGNQVQLYHINNSGCGGIGLWADSGATGGLFGHRVLIENSSLSALGLGANSFAVFYDWSGFEGANQQPLGVIPIIQNNGGTLKMYGGYVLMCNLAQPCLTNGSEAYASGTGSSLLYSDGASFLGNNGTNNSGILNTVASTNVFINSNITAAGTGKTIQDFAGTVTSDLGANTTSGGAGTTIVGTVVGSNSIATTLAVAGNFVPSANWGTSAAVSAVTGNSTNFTFTLTNGSAAVGANPTIAFTFPLSFWATPARCSIWQVGGTQALTALTTYLAPSAQSKTGVTFTYNGTPTINLTEFYQGSCTN